nr:unnamed protein product [Digitaria exilis]
MANYPCNPMLYVPHGMHIEQGWKRPARSRVALGGEPPRRHEQFAILSLHPAPEVQAQIPELIDDVVAMLHHDFPVRVVSAFPVVISSGSILRGNGQSWTAVVYILNGQFPDAFRPDEDPVPVDGNPHPIHGDPLVNPNVVPHWHHDVAGAGQDLHAEMGMNQEQV